MFSVQKLLAKEDKFFTLLEASAEEARASVRALANLGQELASQTRNQESSYARHRDRKLTEQITTALYATPTTSIQPEDIQDLATALYRITKTVDKFTERALIAPRYVQGVDFSGQIALLEAASDVVLQLVKSLRARVNPKQTKALIDQIQSLENQADKLMPGLYQGLYSGRYGAVQAVLLKDLYELLEKAIDRCRSAGNVISRIVLKNS